MYSWWSSIKARIIRVRGSIEDIDDGRGREEEGVGRRGGNDKESDGDELQRRGGTSSEVGGDQEGGSGDH